MGIRDVRGATLALAREVHARGWAPHHSASIGVRLGPGRFLITPAAVSFGAISDADLVVVDEDGERVSGVRDPSPAAPVHRLSFLHRPDVTASVLAAPPLAVGLSVAATPILPTLLADAVIALGTEIPRVPFSTPDSAAWKDALDDADLLLLERRGVLAVGPTLQSSLLCLETVEHLAEVQRCAMTVGHARELPASEVQELLKARRRMGLGQAGRRDLADMARAQRAVVRPRPATPEGLIGVRTFPPPRSQQL